MPGKHARSLPSSSKLSWSYSVKQHSYLGQVHSAPAKAARPSQIRRRYPDIQPDRANRWTEGVIGLTLKAGQTQPAADEWGTISAWAWGISRCLDYFETDKSVNARQVAITGASRLGKTVLCAGAQDERVAAVFSVVLGEMGASLIRSDWGEALDDMA